MFVITHRHTVSQDIPTLYSCDVLWRSFLSPAVAYLTAVYSVSVSCDCFSSSYSDLIFFAVLFDIVSCSFALTPHSARLASLKLCSLASLIARIQCSVLCFSIIPLDLFCFHLSARLTSL